MVNPLSTKASSTAKLPASSSVQPKTLPPRTSGSMERPVRPSGRWVMEISLSLTKNSGGVAEWREGGVEGFSPARGKMHGARMGFTPCPAQRLHAREQRPSEHPGKVRAALAPVEAFAAQRAARTRQGGEIDPQLCDERRAGGRQGRTIGTGNEKIAGRKAFEHLHAQIARQVVVAD